MSDVAMITEEIYKALAEKGLTPGQVSAGLAIAYINLAESKGAEVKPYSTMTADGHMPAGYKAVGGGVSKSGSNAYAAAKAWLDIQEPPHE